MGADGNIFSLIVGDKLVRHLLVETFVVLHLVDNQEVILRVISLSCRGHLLVMLTK